MKKIKIWKKKFIIIILYLFYKFKKWNQVFKRVSKY